MIEKNFWDLLEEKRPQLTKTGITVADYLVEHQQEAELASISTMAKACGVADASIYRFCRQLGFEGYNEMKIALAQSNIAPPVFSFDSLKPGMPTSSLIDYTYSCFHSAMTDTLSAIDLDSIEQASALLTKAERVFCYGQGGSMMLANDIWVRFSTISNKFYTAGDSHLQLMAASLMTPDDVIIFISYSGSTHDMISTLEQAKKAGAKIILITHHTDSIGARLADIVLRCGGFESPLEGGSMPVKVAIFCVADILIHRYSLDNHDLVKSSRKRTSHAMSGKLM